MDARLCVMNSDGSFSADVIPGFVRIGFHGMPADAYVLSATTSGKDMLAEGLEITTDTELHVLLAAAGSVIEGVVRDSSGQPCADSVVVLVPDTPGRQAGPLYRSTFAEADGKFQIRGIAPGRYHLYAWRELDGSAYRNADFMQRFEIHGSRFPWRKPLVSQST